MKLSSGVCPVPALLKAGVNVSIGTDGAASNNDLDMFGEMRSAAFLGKLSSQNPRALDAHTTLSMATIGGARSLGLEHEIGSLEPGKRADLIAVDLGKLATSPVYSPLSALVYSAHGGHVSHVWVGGRAQVREGRLVQLDESALLRDTEAWRVRIAAAHARRQAL